MFLFMHPTLQVDPCLVILDMSWACWSWCCAHAVLIPPWNSCSLPVKRLLIFSSSISALTWNLPDLLYFSTRNRVFFFSKFMWDSVLHCSQLPDSADVHMSYYIASFLKQKPYIYFKFCGVYYLMWNMYVLSAYSRKIIMNIILFY